ncbi:MAG: hypothetical protein HYZ72_09725 [Deltaproteobacteria bacterium]|nr:hypothetical protein [Deltaproteobacteria bacterium]
MTVPERPNRSWRSNYDHPRRTVAPSSGRHPNDVAFQGSEFFNKKIEKALCESVCMIVVFTPTYFSGTHFYCVREYKAMVELEKRRLGSLLKLYSLEEQGTYFPCVVATLDAAGVGAGLKPAPTGDRRIVKEVSLGIGHPVEFELLGASADKENGLIIPIILRGENNLPAEIKNHRHYYDFTKFKLRDISLKKHKLYDSKIEEIADYIHKRFEALNKVSKDPCIGYENFTLPPEAEIRQWLTGVQGSAAPFPGR